MTWRKVVQSVHSKPDQGVVSADAHVKERKEGNNLQEVHRNFNNHYSSAGL